MLPLISVLIPTYNYERFLGMAIDSALAQTYPNVEVVVTDNASTDATPDLIATRYAGEPRVRYFRNERNIGMVANFNLALSHARGAFVLWLSADDWILPGHLERLHDVFAKHPTLDVVYSTIYFADVHGRVYGRRSDDGFLPFDYVDARDELPEMLTGVCPLCLPTALFRRELFEELGGMDERWQVAADWELAVRLAFAGKRFAYVHGPSVCVRVHDANMSGVAFNASGEIVVETVEIVAKYIDHPGMARLRGREGAVMAYLDALYRVKIEQLGRSPFTPAFEERFAQLREIMLARAAAYEPARVQGSRISVVVPVTGPPGPALRAIAAASAQTFADTEVIVVDQSPIPLEELLRGQPGAERVRYARIPPVSRRPGAARNLALRLARGEYLAFLDEDNVIAPTHLAQLAATLERTGAHVAASHSRLVVELADDRYVDIADVATVDGLFRGTNDPPEISAVANALPLNAILHERRYFEHAGAFSETAWLLEDFDYLSRLLSVATLAFAPRSTLEVRVRVGLRAQALGNYVARYLPTLDSLYAARTVDPEIERARERHRAAIEGALARLPGLVETPSGVIELLAALSGRSVFPPRPEGPAEADPG